MFDCVLFNLDYCCEAFLQLQMNVFPGTAFFWKVYCFALSSLKGLHGFFGGFFGLILFPVLPDSTILVNTMLYLYCIEPTQACPCNFINRNSCFWMGWFTTAANIRKSQTIVPLHCANNSDVPFCWLATLLSVAASEGIAARAVRISAFSLLPWYLFLCSFISYPMRLSLSFSLKWQCVFTVLPTNSILNCARAKMVLLLEGKKKNHSKPAKQNSFCAVLDRMLLRL